MAPRQKDALRALTAEERAALAQVSKSSSGRLDEVRRAMALLAVAAGASFPAAAGQGGYRSPTGIAKLVRRFNRRGLASLRIAPGRGRRATYDAAARAQIVATAQREPARAADGTATWSLKLLERALRREGLPTVGATTIRAVLHAAGASYQQTRTWCPTGTAERRRKAGVARVVDPATEQKRG